MLINLISICYLDRTTGYSTIEECEAQGITLSVLKVVQKQWRAAIHSVCSKPLQDRFDNEIGEDELWQGTLMYRILAQNDAGSRKASVKSKTDFEAHKITIHTDIDNFLTEDSVLYARMVANEAENKLSDKALIIRLVDKMPTNSKYWEFLSNNIKLKIGDEDGICKSYASLQEWLREKCNQGFLTKETTTEDDHTFIHSALLQRITQGEKLSTNVIKRAFNNTDANSRERNVMVSALISATQSPRENSSGTTQSKRQQKPGSPFQRHASHIATVSKDEDNVLEFDYETSSAY